MAPTPIPLFSDYKQLTSTHLVQNNVIPPQTYLTGHLMAVWGGIRSQKAPKTETPRIIFRLQCRVPVAPNENPTSLIQANYIPPSSAASKGRVYRIKLNLRYMDGIHVDEIKMERDREKVVAINGKEVQVDCSSMRVIAVGKDGEGKIEVEMVGTGERRIARENAIIKVLSDPPVHRKPPGWLPSSPIDTTTPPTQPSPRPTIIKAFPSTTSSRSTSNGNAQAGPSRLKPLSAHLPGIIIPNIKQKQSNGTAMQRKGSSDSAAMKEREIIGRSVSRGEEVVMAAETITEHEPLHVDHPNGFHHPKPQIDNGTPAPLATIPPISPAAEQSPARPQSAVAVSAIAGDLLEPPRQARQRSPTPPPAPESPSPPEPSILPPAPNQMASTPYRQTQADALAKRRRAAEDEARAIKRAKLDREGAERARVEYDEGKLRRPLVLGERKYTPISEIQNGIANVIGIVIEVKPAGQSSTGDYFTTVILTDPSNHTGDVADENFLITIFRRTAEELPVNWQAGTAVLFRGLKVKTYNNKCKGHAFSPEPGRISTTWASLSSDGKRVNIANEREMQPGLGKVEVERMLQISEWWKGVMKGGDENVGYIDEGRYAGGGSGLRRRNIVGSVAGGGKVYTLGSVWVGLFCDVVFKICHVVANSNPRLAMELYITDGTISNHPTRNYHNVDASIPPSALFCLAIQEMPQARDMAYFQVGNVLMLRNVRIKMYQGGLELFWSDKVNDQQAREGWGKKNVRLMSKTDERAREIERRIKALERGEIPEPTEIPSPIHRTSSRFSIDVNNLQTSQFQHTTIINPSTTIVTRSPVEGRPKAKAISIATHLKTTYVDDVDHPLSTFEEVLENRLVPNRFRVRARVKSVISRGLGGVEKGSLVQAHCGKCRRYFQTNYCQSCNDTTYTHASYRYRFIILLVPPDTDLSLPSPNPAPPIIAATISDDEALKFLPPLPPFSQGPNEIKRNNTRLKSIVKDVQDVLMGARQDGERPHSVVEWGLECSVVKGPGKAGDEVLIHRVFGMEGG